MQVTVAVLICALGHNSFVRLYVAAATLPREIVMVSYLPHGIMEMLAFVLAGTFSLPCIDSIPVFLRDKKDATDLHPGDISLFIIGRVWRQFALVLFLMAVAAAIECWVTPHLVKAALEAALQ
jgi:uncharacterized membrane protein SpoIIM required for sporulation